ncbi:hypothetical protein HMPREF9447_02963 [Bacteroides oleiciplenus YIT 12058]|uniref:Uncharacterized protein n=1 Tax=Bacteroides oleiciplenus YIT 12058 TaxID=742727 RepID=K9EK59_9BACE|nr:hypothetical protein HMPREF9447_02963 [Bacteroides oleiciplenus YIT 12058]
MRYVNRVAQDNAKTLRLGCPVLIEMIYFILAKLNEKVVVGSSRGSPFTFTPLT